MKRVEIEGKNITDLASFYDEIEKKLTYSLNWKIGRNLDAFNDVLRGGFGVHDLGETLNVVWKNHKNSERTLGWNETEKYIQSKLKRCYPKNIPSISNDLELAKKHEGKTLFETIVDIIHQRENVRLQLK
jgi:RNAse (barnase) inhibitor barstar